MSTSTPQGPPWIDDVRRIVSSMLDGLEQKQPISAIVLFQVDPAREDVFTADLRTLAAGTRRLPGLKIFSFQTGRPFAMAEGAPPEFLIYEEWKTVHQFRRQWESEHLKAFQHGIGGLVVAPPDLRFYWGSDAVPTCRAARRCWRPGRSAAGTVRERRSSVRAAARTVRYAPVCRSRSALQRERRRHGDRQPHRTGVAARRQRVRRVAWMDAVAGPREPPTAATASPTAAARAIGACPTSMSCRACSTSIATAVRRCPTVIRSATSRRATTGRRPRWRRRRPSAGTPRWRSVRRSSTSRSTTCASGRCAAPATASCRRPDRRSATTSGSGCAGGGQRPGRRAAWACRRRSRATSTTRTAR